MMKFRTSKLIMTTAVLALSSSHIGAVDGKKDDVVNNDETEEVDPLPDDIDFDLFAAALLDADSATSTTTTTTTTTSSSRAAEWGTMATTTTSPTTPSPTLSPSTAPTTSTPSISPTKRLVNNKGDVLTLCQPSLEAALSFDTNNSNALDKHEFSQFIESVTGDDFTAAIILNEVSDKLYNELRQACELVFKMNKSCHDETTTADDDDGDVGGGGVTEFVYDGVQMTGFQKSWNEKAREEQKYEKFFCDRLIGFYVANDLPLDWTLVDGTPAEVEGTEVDDDGGNSTLLLAVDTASNTTTTTTTTTTASSNNNTNTNNATVVDPAAAAAADAVDWSALADLIADDNDTEEEEEENNTTTYSSSPESSSPELVVATTTVGNESFTPGEEEDEDENTTNTASEINNVDTSFVQSNTIKDSPSSDALDKIPLGGWIGIGLGGVLLAFLLAAVIVTRNRRRNGTGRQAGNINDDDSIWSDVDEEKNMMAGAGGSHMSSVAAIGMASTVATRLTTGDTEVTLMKKQLWTEKEPVV